MNVAARPFVTSQPAAAAPSRLLVDQVPDDRWHQAMQGFEDLHYEQTALYGAGQRGEKSSHILAMHESGLAWFGARVGLYTIPVLNTGLALVRFGPFWRKAHFRMDINAYKSAITTLISEYCEKRRLYLIIRPRAHPDIYPMEAKALVGLGLRSSASTMLDRYFVDASLSEQDQRASLSQEWRRKLKKGEAQNLRLQISEKSDDVAAFQQVYAEMVNRKNLNYPGLELAQLIPHLMELRGQMRMLLCLAYREDKLISGAAFAVVGDVAYYVFGATSDAAGELQSGYVMQWTILRWLRENTNVRWYELGGPGDPGIQQFKKGLAGKRGALLPIEEFHYCNSTIARASVKALYVARDARNVIQRWSRRN